MALGSRDFGRVVLVVGIGACLAGCGQISDGAASADDAGSGAGTGGSIEASAGRGSTARGGSSESGGGAGYGHIAGGPGGGGGGQETFAGSAGEAAAGTPDGECVSVHRVEVQLPSGGSAQPSVVKSGDEFALTDGATLVVASWARELARHEFDAQVCPSCYGLFGVTPLRAELGWRLLSIDRAARGDSVVAARARGIDDTSLAEEQPLFGPEFLGLVSAFGVRPSRDAKRALFANGHRAISQEVTFAVLDTSGRMLAAPSKLAVPFPNWMALSVVPTAHAGAISVLAESADGAERVWLLSELNASGELVFSSRVVLPPDQRCVAFADECAVVEDADGYYIGLRDTTGQTRIARLLRARPNELVIDQQPTPAGGILVGAFPGTLVFLVSEQTANGTRASFVGLAKSGAGEARKLGVIPPLGTVGGYGFELIALEGRSIFYGMRSGGTQVIGELSCSSAL